MTRRSFTLLEAIIVLGVTALIFTITIPQFTQGQQKMQEEQFWRLFRHQWRLAQIRAKTKGYVTKISYLTTDKALYFCSADEKKILYLPSTLKADHFQEFYILQNGYTRARTLRFRSSRNKHYYLVRIQLGWGGYRIEEQTAKGILNGR